MYCLLCPMAFLYEAVKKDDIPLHRVEPFIVVAYIGQEVLMPVFYPQQDQLFIKADAPRLCEMETVVFDAEDVITTSPNRSGDGWDQFGDED